MLLRRSFLVEWISGALVVAVIILLFLLVRKRQREQADGDVEHSAKLSESTSTSKQSQQESASTTMPERNKPYLSADEREAVDCRKCRQTSADRPPEGLTNFFLTDTLRVNHKHCEPDFIFINRRLYLCWKRSRICWRNSSIWIRIH